MDIELLNPDSVERVRFTGKPIASWLDVGLSVGIEAKRQEIAALLLDYNTNINRIKLQDKIIGHSSVRHKNKIKRNNEKFIGKLLELMV